jgi:alpha-tubulin suppressor-like RCC1 family protein
MAIVTAEAKFYQSFRTTCVDKNITANLSTTFNVGANVAKVKFYVCDMESVASVALVDERYKTYGAGNNVITPGTPRVIDNTNNAKIISTLVCKFPTYFRVDLEALGLPEGTDIIVDFEEAFAFEGNYPSSLNAPMPLTRNFTTFRTPWYGLGFLDVTSTVSSIIGNIKQFNIAVAGAMNFVAQGNYSPADGVQMSVSQFNISAKITYAPAENILTLFAFTGEGSEQWLGFMPIRIRDFESILQPATSSISVDFDVVVQTDASLESSTDISADANITTDIVSDLTATSNIFVVVTQNTFPLDADLTFTFTLDAIIGEIEQMAIDSSVVASVSATANVVRDTSLNVSSISTISISADIIINEIYVWGSDTLGQLGLGISTSAGSRTPDITLLGSSQDWIYVSPDQSSSTFAINRDGEMWAWGGNSNGQLGFDSGNAPIYNPVLVPTKVGTSSNWSKISVGSHTLAINNLGELYSWGSNSNGQLGQGDTTFRLTPTQVGTATNWVDISIGPTQSYAINSLGELWACGSNSLLGFGISSGNTLTFTKLGTATNWVNISAGASTLTGKFAVNALGELWAWGNYTVDSALEFVTSATPIRFGTDSDWSQVDCGNRFALGIKTSGALFSWGSNQSGRTGLGTTAGGTRNPTQVGTATNWQYVSAGDDHSMAVNSLGELWAWGDANDNETGFADFTDRTVPTQLGTDTNWVRVYAKLNYTIALKRVL